MVSREVTRYDAAQQAAIASLQSRVQYCKTLWYEGEKRGRASIRGSSGEEGSS